MFQIKLSAVLHIIHVVSYSLSELNEREAVYGTINLQKLTRYQK